jgi:hypothetical protein
MRERKARKLGQVGGFGDESTESLVEDTLEIVFGRERESEDGR